MKAAFFIAIVCYGILALMGQMQYAYKNIDGWEKIIDSINGYLIGASVLIGTGFFSFL